MENNNMEIWDKVRTPPQAALKKIKGGRLKGMTDISPQWRYQVLTEIFGPCGFGWRYEVTKLWLENGSDGIVTAFATIDFFYKPDSEWSSPIPGLGGSMFVAKESSGMHTSDEAFKMAITDALSVAVKMIGVASDIYMGNMDGSKYRLPVMDEKLAEAEERTRKGNIKNWINIWKGEKEKGADGKAWWEEVSKVVVGDCGKDGAKEVLAEVKK